MANEVKTKVVLEAESKGIPQAQQQISQLSREATKAIDDQVKGFDKSGKAYKTAQKEIEKLEKELQGLAQRQVAVTKAMEEVGDKTSDTYKELAYELKQVDQQAGKISRTISQLDRAFMRTQAARQGFVQGLGQGLAPGAMQFIQRGPGMREQMAGAAIGRGVRGAAQAVPGMVGGMFSGPQAAAGALRGIPFVGGALAAMIERPMQQAQQAMGYYQARMEAMPYVGGVGLQQQMKRAGERARSTLGDQEIERQASRDRTHEALLPKPQHYRRAQAEARGVTLPPETEGRPSIFDPEFRMVEEEGTRPALDREAQRQVSREQTHKAQAKAQVPEKAGGDLTLTEKAMVLGIQATGFKAETKVDEMGVPEDVTEDVEARAMELAGEEAETRTRRNLRRERRRRGGAARQRTEQRALELGTGTQFGFDLIQELQTRRAIQQVGGGLGRTEQERDLAVTGMAAQRAFGVEAGVTGAFLQAGRQGGLVGAQPGEASKLLTESLADAMKLGLEGSEINDYLQQMASGITSWKTTGIPFNKQSMADIAGTLGTMGMGGVRGMAIAGGVSRAAEQLSRTGPQSVGQLMMLQTLGGMAPGKTGMEAMEEALIKLEEKSFEGKDFKLLLERLTTAGGGGAEGRRVAYGVLSGMGINITRGELKRLDEGAPPDLWEQQRQKRIETGEKRARDLAATPEKLIEAGRMAVPQPLVKQAELTNQQIQAGKEMVGSMHNLEQVAQRITNVMADKIGPTLETLTKSLDGFTVSMVEVVEGKKSIGDLLVGGSKEGT